MKIKREKIIMFRASTLEKRIIENRAKATGITTADFCRRSALNKEVGYRLTPDEIEVYKSLTQTKVNFSRISNLIRDRKDIAAEVRQVIDIINRHLIKLQ